MFNNFSKVISSEDLGTTVYCDICGVDYTFKSDIGGMIFESKAYCPICTKRSLRDIVRYKEEKHIKAVCPPDTSFWVFVVNYRESNSKIEIRVEE